MYCNRMLFIIWRLNKHTTTTMVQLLVMHYELGTHYDVTVVIILYLIYSGLERSDQGDVNFNGMYLRNGAC